ncbi:Glutathione S-transferase 1, isoform D [Eumeta japonica]|uniref:Glutathione S-transferase 1, isoform D n=1 Tax=Eumeta variegata TaxID=151549 RepID=A0A4C1X0M1_EUMVA|nr:Glutathione S-transferase 1, isoform D [Eumeta japonica]
MRVKLYHFPMSPPSRGALLAARAVGVPIEVVFIDLLKKEQLNEDFVKINPQHCIPTLDDDGFILWESRAIACYLADKYAKNDQLYPKDLKKRAIINQRLYFDSSFLFVKIRGIFFPILFQGKTTIDKAAKDDLNTTLGFLEKFLSDNIWVAGDNYTIADTSIYASVSSLVATGWDISLFPNIKRWLNECSSLPGYAENADGAKTYGEAVKRNLAQK